MTFDVLIQHLIDDTLKTSIPRFLPELVLCATIVLLLFTRILRSTGRVLPIAIALAGSLVAFWFALPAGGFDQLSSDPPRELFTGMLIYDALTVYLRLFLLLFAVLFIVMATITGLADRDDSQDVFTLVLGAILGMCIMASANHLITIFLGVEMASVPSYVLAGIIKGRRRASEAALKYAVYGAGTAGIMLYGISLLAGVLGTAHLPTMAKQLAAMDIPSMMATGELSGTLMVLALAGLMVMVGLAFKLSAVPFHFWCPDVFEGASAEVNAFLSVASKAAALVLLVRVTVGLGVLPSQANLVPEPAEIQTNTAESVIQLVSAADDTAHEEGRHAPGAADPLVSTDPLAPVRVFMTRLIAILAVVTCTFGNLAAYGQSNIKRMLAYSTIAHAGYMMMAVAAVIALADRGSLAENALAALLVYVGIYLFMNLGAFAIVAFLRNAMGSEEIADYAGLMRSCPVTSVAMVAILFSLVGLPPLAGFIGKFFIFASLVEAGGSLMIFLLVVGGINTVLSLVYYLRVAKVICIDPEPDSRPPVSLGFIPVCYAAAVTFPVLLLGIWPSWLLEIAEDASRHLFSG